MAYTAHGFHIPGTDKLTVKELGPIAVCGGPALCLACKKEIEIHGMMIGTNDDHVEKAKRIVFEYVTKKHRGENFTVYVVWFTYILGNWKALVSTTRADSMYYEVTYDTRNKVAYLDPYKKMDNITIPDEDRVLQSPEEEKRAIRKLTCLGVQDNCHDMTRHKHGNECYSLCAVCHGKTD